MIFVDRSRVSDPLDPKSKLGERAIKEIERVADAMARGDLEQRKFKFSIYKKEEVREALDALFYGKCAYCETKIAAGAPFDIDQFRPKDSVTERADHPGYWWLANDWNNLFLSCQNCNRRRRHKSIEARAKARKFTESTSLSGKGNHFPLEFEDTRAMDPSDPLAAETTLLLDPTVNYPEDHLIYEDGVLHGQSLPGNTTIELLGLNRIDLVDARRSLLEIFFRTIEPLLGTLKIEKADLDKVLDLQTTIQNMMAPDAEYAGLIRQAFQELHFPKSHPLYDWAQNLSNGKHVTKSSIRTAKQQSASFRADRTDYSLDTDEGVDKFRSAHHFVESVKIKNIRAIKSLDLDLNKSTKETTPWMMLLGENGTGKSTVLQSISLALGGTDQVQRLLDNGQLDLESLVRTRCKSGQITVKLTEFTAPHKIEVFRDRLEFRGPHGQAMTLRPDTKGLAADGRWDAQALMLGYGATRLLPRDANSAPPTGQFTRVDNLFDAFVPLLDAKAWLLGLDDLVFRETALVLKSLLSLEDSDKLVRADGNVYVVQGSNKTLLKEMSDGYRSILAMTVDMLDVLSRIWPNLSEAVGLVLIDELDAHLHPTWQMKIVSALRGALPGVQFITTTHQPLCLRGLGEHEVVVMKRDEDKRFVEVETDLPSPSDLRVGQLLTSEFFGLRSTIDPELELQFTRYYQLLAMDDLKEQEQQELSQLKALLDNRQYLGDSYRESLVYKAVDAHLAQQETKARVSPKVLEQRVIDEVGDMWAKTLSDLEDS